MCGIIAYCGARQASEVLLEGLQRLEYRGYDSAGVAIHDATRTEEPIARARAQGKIAALRQRLDQEPIPGHTGIGHTRWATHGRPSEQNAHPHRGGTVCVVHNGIIENHQSLRSELSAEGRVFHSETDSEVIAHLVDRELEQIRDLSTAVMRACARLTGAWAICVVADGCPGEIVGARMHSPLLVGIGSAQAGASQEHFLASDVSAVLSWTRDVLDLDDGDTVSIRAEGFVVLDREGHPARRPRRRIDWSPIAAEKQGFKHFMLKEIFEQPRAVRQALMGESAVASLVAALEAKSIQRVLLLGCGTSWHAALVGKYLLESVARVGVEVEVASEFRYRDPVVEPGTLAIAISQSGETADTLAAIREAKSRGARTMAICNVVDSSIPRLVEHTLYTQAGPEISVASTKAFTTQIVLLTLLGLHLAEQRGVLGPEALAAHRSAVAARPQAIETVLEESALIRAIAKRHLSARDVLFLGRGTCFPVALEGALKLKEISYVHAEGYASGEMKHGPIALIDEHVPVVVLALEGRHYDKSLSNLEEVKSRGGKVIAVGSAGDEQLGKMTDEHVLIPSVTPLAAPILACIPLQLFAYHFADLRGTDVDQPRNLAKSVTVE